MRPNDARIFDISLAARRYAEKTLKSSNHGFPAIYLSANDTELWRRTLPIGTHGRSVKGIMRHWCYLYGTGSTFLPEMYTIYIKWAANDHPILSNIMRWRFICQQSCLQRSNISLLNNICPFASNEQKAAAVSGEYIDTTEGCGVSQNVQPGC